ncbi:hypothetical protein Tco_0906542 [Tanacetum coccineum]|uniref:Uncharacterized protein n=1 Tax=Tanacetum coccineum TaxID=301880 RepID=A0ABQ5CJI5_9ASTR
MHTLYKDVTLQLPEEKQIKRDVKARGLLLMALPNEHQLTFSQYPDAKSMFAAIETRFRGNAATKKTQKTLLKQEPEFKVSDDGKQDESKPKSKKKTVIPYVAKDRVTKLKIMKKPVKSKFRYVHEAKRHYYTRRHYAVNTARSYLGQVNAVRVKGLMAGKHNHDENGLLTVDLKAHDCTMETKDTLSSCSNSEEQQMQQIQDKAKKSCMKVVDSIKRARYKQQIRNDAHADDADTDPYMMKNQWLSSELGIHDHSNELSSSKLVPKVVPPGRMSTKIELTLEQSQQGVSNDVLSPTHYPCDSARTFRVILFSIHNDEWKSFQCHHQTALRSYALSWKPCQGDSLNLPDHRIHKDGDGDASFQLKSDSLPHAHAHSTKTFYKHQDSRIMKAQELKTKTSANSDINDNSSEIKFGGDY